jgi:hypothetical protein
MTLLIGTLSLVQPDLIGRTVWTRFGLDYGFFPFFQPILGLVWLFWPETLRAYGIRGDQRIGDQSTQGPGGDH